MATKLFALWPNDTTAALPPEIREQFSFVACSTAAANEASARANANKYGRERYALNWSDPTLVGCVEAACFGPMPAEGWTSFSEIPA
jgi:hypothetical protein